MMVDEFWCRMNGCSKGDDEQCSGDGRGGAQVYGVEENGHSSAGTVGYLRNVPRDTGAEVVSDGRVRRA